MVERQHPDERDVDAIFESIVARWDEEAPSSRPRGHGDEDAQDAAPDDDPTSAEPPEEHPKEPRHQSTGEVRAPTTPTAPTAPTLFGEGVPWRTDPTNSVADALLGQDDSATAGDEEGFTPPPTAPLPPLSDRLFWGALGGLVLGPLGLIWLVLVQPAVGDWVNVVVFGLILGGFACLVWRQPRNRGDDPDKGARV